MATTKKNKAVASASASASVSNGLQAALKDKIAGTFVLALQETGNRRRFLERGVGYAKNAIAKREAAIEGISETEAAIDAAFEAGDESKLARVMKKFRKVSVPALPTKRDEDYEGEDASE